MFEMNIREAFSENNREMFLDPKKYFHFASTLLLNVSKLTFDRSCSF